MGCKVAVFGSYVVDLMGRTPHLPVPGETVKGSVFKMGAGGKGFNQAVAAHKAGAVVTCITKMGRDSFADVALNTMEELGMSREHLFFHDTVETGIALILVDENTSQNEIVIVPGACATISDEDIAGIEEVIREAEYVLLQLEVNPSANESVIKMAEKYHTKVILNTAPYQPVRDDLLEKVYMVTPNEVEAEAMTGIPVVDLEGAKKAAKVFFDKGVKKVVITLGERGVFVSSDGREEIIPGFQVKATDTTGAGDAFNGGLLTALSEGKDLWEAARFANGVAALSVQKLGTTPSMPTRAEVDQFLSEHKG
ncbi:MAG: ribokinase [Lachnospiraceae bacterium]|nr:ribokinase [Lachnospiraceae bacterium]MDY5741825.1 ribokinase [Lachnospiraceae bacterium]